MSLDAFSILYQDDDIVAIHKSAGLLVHPSPIEKNVSTTAVQLLEEQLETTVYPVHRLDRPTSGILIFALNIESARHLNQQFFDHSITKTYLALCRGKAPLQGQIDKPLKYQRDKLADANKQTDTLQIALTEFICLSHRLQNFTIGHYTTQTYSLMQLHPKTGRKHQLRRHLKHLNHPIIGDTNYGDRHHNHLFQDKFHQQRLYLAATQISITHPRTHQTMHLAAALEPSFHQILEQLWPADNLAQLLSNHYNEAHFTNPQA